MASVSHFTAFTGHRRLISGPLADVALAVRKSTKVNESILIFDDTTGKALDVDLRGTDEDILARLPLSTPATAATEPPASEPRGRGRPLHGQPAAGRERPVPDDHRHDHAVHRARLGAGWAGG